VNLVLLLLALGFGTILLYTRQLNWAVSVAKNSAAGVLGLLLFNFLFSGFGLVVGVNLVTVLIVGVLGAPGFFLLYAAQMLI
jgi:inhibitor of the pro-sigma K processing machinery